MIVDRKEFESEKEERLNNFLQDETGDTNMSLLLADRQDAAMAEGGQEDGDGAGSGISLLSK